MNIVFLVLPAKNAAPCGLNQMANRFIRNALPKRMLQTLANIPACLIGIEASTGAFYWQREFEKLGHKVKVISPQYVKPLCPRAKMMVMMHRPSQGSDATDNGVRAAKKPRNSRISVLYTGQGSGIVKNHRTATVC